MVNEVKLGLGNPPHPIYLYVKNEEMGGEQYVWYKYIINSKEKIPVHQRALTGYICELRLREKDYKGQDNLKLDIVISADELYVIRSGINTNFAKSFLLAASVVEDFSKPLTIVVNPGNETVVFCSLYDAQSKTKIRRDWDAKADFAGIIQDIQSRLSFAIKYEIDDEDIFGLEQLSTVKLHSNSVPKSKAIAPPVHPQDTRVRQIRTLLDYPVDLIKEWLQFQDAKAPSQLPQASIDELVKTMCLAWAAPKADPYRAETTYQQQVLEAIANGTDEVTAIREWMNYVVGQRAAVAAR
ncbi:hypothetical protein ACN23B_27175 (plasmid) [Anabaena sp. FACHB-709]|uniref:Uncharacterized protein n=2 Tax=Nostocaceae TaxID=1162 RepID=A0A1Z4KV47_ANAVA|nr:MULTISPECIES: hypothetical protein [Nostocaceae]BAY72763.1 hypothetical protein NIES23_55910 [Trichormus variabilis NIES-23]MBD2175001.1 hypothetical protein [Anabaena cylindrica FACHB-318]MBD2266640.1 hypothetical protein [Anabaena sp. FACHB-709]MBD2276266.1 hypothetical protein [Nostoc sp. PCC 7120 = FACHB-418]MBD2287226.1 hypothetical protein [Anabaena cylindrica FACHB-170]